MAGMVLFSASAKDTKPVYPEGDKALKQYFIDKMPTQGDADGIKKLTLMLKIDTVGNVIQALPQVSDEKIKATVVKAALALPKFIPGTVNGKAANAWVKIVVPLDGKKSEPKRVYVTDYTTLTEIIIVNDEDFKPQMAVETPIETPIPATARTVVTSKAFSGKIYRASEVTSQPTFPGGEVALSDFIKKNIQYPAGVSQGLTGSVLVKAIIAEDGSIAESSVVKGMAPDFNAEALRVVQCLPQFTPAEYKGKPVNCQRVITVLFSPQ